MVASKTSTEIAIPAGVRTRRWPRAQQCSATKDDGQQCRRRALRGGRVCYVHGGQLPSVRAAAEAEVAELRARALSIADRALDVVEEALEDKDPSIRLRASAQVLDRVMPKPQPGASVSVVVGEPLQEQSSPAEVIRARLTALRTSGELQLHDELQQLPREIEPLQGELLDRAVDDDWDWAVEPDPAF